MTTDLVPTGGGGRPPTQPPKRNVAKDLRITHDILLRPYRSSAAVCEKFPEWWRKASSLRDVQLTPQIIRRSRAKNPERVAEVKAWLDGLPDEATSSALLADLDLLNAGFDRPMTAQVIGMMINGFPNARPHDPEGYAEGLIFEIREAGFSPSAVARACRAVVNEMAFLPAPSELLERCRKASSAVSEIAMVEKMVATRDAAIEAFDEADRLGPWTEAEEWRIVMRSYCGAKHPYWPTYDAGPAPGLDGCRVPAEILAEFDNIPAPPPPPDPLEIRF